MDEMRAISTFIKTASLGSFRKAAIDQGITPQAASKAVMQLEKELGVRLFHRTTRKLSLTEEGIQFLENARPGLETLHDAVRQARQATEGMEGSLRVSGPRSLGLQVLMPLFLRFAEKYPQVQLDVQLDDRFSDLVPDRIDVGFRAGTVPDGRMIARRLMPIQHIICASPSYLEKHGKPASIAELMQHQCTGYRLPNTGKQMPWEFQIGGEIHYRDIPATICTNDTQAETEAVLAGLGIGQLGSFTAVPLIREGRLIPLLTEHITERMALHVYYSTRANMTLQLIGSKEFYFEPEETSPV
ncbi:LysR family transcriptional regulator [Undibacterium terreum]|uniref:LysR family transcriptional regulator n=1 Tax=Undibacterium terreum TaxID=1224302 RepID=A0A916UJA3_9BURK|nr:LysR family transcriptional regulator [Undibacterium terreum]GGC74385.1 LysR family transcriptional regulator [Undibacterium terreum]